MVIIILFEKMACLVASIVPENDALCIQGHSAEGSILLFWLAFWFHKLFFK